MTSRTLGGARGVLLSPHWIWLGLLVLAFAPTIAWLFDRWTLNIYYNGHGIFVPLIVAYLVRENLKRDPVTEPDSSPWGFLFLGAGLAMLAADTAIRTDLLAAAGMVVCLPGISLLLLGAERTKAIAFPLVIIAFMLPIPAGFLQTLYLWLRETTAIGTELVIGWLNIGVPILRQGTLLITPHSGVQVADSCSGFSTLYAALTTALILAHLGRSNSRRALLIVSAVVLALAANIVRVVILTLIIHYYGVDPLETPILDRVKAALADQSQG